MRQYILIILIACLLTASCSDDMNMPDGEGCVTENISVSYSTGGYTGSRADALDYCWQSDGWNENSINSLDLFLIKEDVITAYWNKVYTTPNSIDCGIDNTHKFLEVTQNMPQFSVQKVAASDHICLIANQDFSTTSPIGKKVSELLKNVTTITHDSKQSQFVMLGYIATPEAIGNSKNYNINIPLERVAAKIRITLVNTDLTPILPENYAIKLCHYVTISTVFPDESVNTQLDYWEKNLNDNVKITESSLSKITCADNAIWDVNEDLIGSRPPVYENGSVFYTYPTDWFKYSVIRRCTRADNYFNKKDENGKYIKDENGKDKKFYHGEEYHNNNTETHLEVRYYDSEEPIKSDRQVFAIVQAPYKDGKYYYKVPVNRRFYEKSDALCFSIDEIRNKILPLYRADRNHFYDVKAIIDRPGAPNPEEAINNPMFTATIAPLTDGGTFDYIYD